MKRRRPMCVRCGVEQFDWPRAFSQAFFEAHACPSGRGHLYVDERRVAGLVQAHG